MGRVSLLDDLAAPDHKRVRAQRDQLAYAPYDIAHLAMRLLGAHAKEFKRLFGQIAQEGFEEAPDFIDAAVDAIRRMQHGVLVIVRNDGPHSLLGHECMEVAVHLVQGLFGDRSHDVFLRVDCRWGQSSRSATVRRARPRPNGISFGVLRWYAR